jgi:hypothetical protein
VRNTVTLDPDGERLLRVAMKFVQKTFRMGPAREFRWDKALAVSDAIEGEELTPAARCGL